MKRDPGHGRRQPSRIYAGNEPLPPVHPFVPLALVAPLIAVWRVQVYFFDQLRWYGLTAWPSDDSVAADAIDLSAARVEGLTRGLLAASAVCLLPIVARWWRGRREWGDVPLAHGIAVCVLALLVLSWQVFGTDGEYAGVAMLATLGFQADLLLLCAGSFAAYLLVELATRPARRRRWTVAFLLLAPLTGLALLPFGGERAMRELDILRGFAGTPRSELPSASSPSWSNPFGYRHYDGGGWSPMYVLQDGAPAMLWVRSLWDGSWRTTEAVPLSALSTRERSRPELVREEGERIRARFDSDREGDALTTALVWLPRDAPASTLTRIAGDCREAFPSVWNLRVFHTPYAAASGLGIEVHPVFSIGEFLIRLDAREFDDETFVNEGGAVVAPAGDSRLVPSSRWYSVRIEEGATMQDLARAMGRIVLEAGPHSIGFQLE